MREMSTAHLHFDLEQPRLFWSRKGQPDILFDYQSHILNCSYNNVQLYGKIVESMIQDQLYLILQHNILHANLIYVIHIYNIALDVVWQICVVR